MTERRLISSGSAFEKQIGYSRAVVTGEWVFISGCTGYDYETGTISPNVADQADQAMRNVMVALTRAGAVMADVVRVRYILPDRRDFPTTWPCLGRWLGDVRPAATMIQAGLMEEVMKFEVEVTARKGSGGAGGASVESRKGQGEVGGGGGDAIAPPA